MSNNCCSSEDIFQLNNSKEYVLLSQRILELVVTDQQLHAQAAKLWQFLYAKAKFDPQLSITVSYQLLAETLGKSVRTISRYITNLVEQGYLDKDANFANSGSRLANTLFVRIPAAAVETLYASNNRKRDIKVSTITSTESIEKPAPAVIPTDKIDNSSPDSYGITNNNIKKITNNNTDVVVDYSSTIAVEPQQDNIDLMELKQQIQVIAEQHQQLNQQFRTHSPEQQKKLLPQLTQLEGKKEALQLFYSQQEKAIAKKTLQPKSHHNFETEGQRAFNRFETHRLMQGLTTICAPEKIPELLNEITYAIRFGELRIQQATGKNLSIHHAISIALKLVREGRWEVPKGLKGYQR